MAKSSRNLNAKAAQLRSVPMETKRIYRVGRNQKCPCGSEKKYKDCHASEGQPFLQKLARQAERQRLEEELRESGAPWYERWFRRALG